MTFSNTKKLKKLKYKHQELVMKNHKINIIQISYKEAQFDDSKIYA